MTREETIKNLLTELIEMIDNGSQKDLDRADEIATTIIKALEQEPKTEWVPVSERLPEEFKSVLVCYKSQGGMAQVVSERFGTHTGYRWSALAGIEPIAWMPLPKPYEAESEV